MTTRMVEVEDCFGIVVSVLVPSDHDTRDARRRLVEESLYLWYRLHHHHHHHMTEEKVPVIATLREAAETH